MNGFKTKLTFEKIAFHSVNTEKDVHLCLQWIQLVRFASVTMITHH